MATRELFLLAALQARGGWSPERGLPVPGQGSCMCPVLCRQERLPCDPLSRGGRDQKPCETFPVPPALPPLFPSPQ